MSVSVTIVVNRDGDKSRVELYREDQTEAWSPEPTSFETVADAVSMAVQRVLAAQGIATAVGIDEVRS